MTPGRDLDRLVAEKVMGWEWPANRCPVCGWPFDDSREIGCVPGDCSQRPQPDPIASEAWPPYSTRIESAMRVVEHLGPSVYWHITRSPTKGWIVSLDCTEPFVRTTPGAEADTASHAICLAALKAVDTEVPS